MQLLLMSECKEQQDGVQPEIYGGHPSRTLSSLETFSSEVSSWLDINLVIIFRQEAPKHPGSAAVDTLVYFQISMTGLLNEYQFRGSNFATPRHQTRVRNISDSSKPPEIFDIAFRDS
jgi:hypothetical protein